MDELSIWIEIFSNWAVITVGLYVSFLLIKNTKAQLRVLAKLDALPRPILKDLQRKAKKASKHEVKYMIDVKLRTADQVVKGE